MEKELFMALLEASIIIRKEVKGEAVWNNYSKIKSITETIEKYRNTILINQ